MKPFILSNIGTFEELTYILHQQSNNQLCVVIFTAKWCGPCQNLKREIFNELKEDGLSVVYSKKGVRFFYLDVDENRELVESSFRINSIPTTFFIATFQEKDEIVYKQLDVVSGGKDKIINKLEYLLDI